MRSKFSKVIVGSDQKDLLVRHNALQEGFSSKFGRELASRINIRIDLAPQRFPRRREGMDDICELCFADDHYVEIAATPFVPSCDRTVNEGRPNSAGQRFERGAQHIGDACRLLENVAQVLVDRTLTVRLKLNLIANGHTQQDACVDKPIELAKQRAGRLSNDSRYLADVQRDARVQ